MKKSFYLRLLGMVIISVLMFAGCSFGGKSTKQTASTLTSGNTLKNIDTKNITDKDLINSAAEDTPTELDSVENQTKQLSSDEIDLLLNDNINNNFKEEN